MSQANQTHNLSRRAVLAGSTAALVAAVPVGAALSSSDDAALLAQVAQFGDLYERWQRAWEKQHTHRAQIEAMQDCPPLNGTVQKGRDHIAFLKEHDAFKHCDEVNRLGKQTGALANAIFATPAQTPRGVLEKTHILHAALGDYPDDGDANLEGYQVDGEPTWFGLVIADLERIVREGRS